MGLSISINDQAAFNVVIGIPGPAGETGPQGPAGPPGPAGSSIWGTITGTLSNQTDLQNALDAKLSLSAASSTYLPLAGGYITGDLISYNGSGLYSVASGSASTYTNVTSSGIQISGGTGPSSGSMSIQWDGISFVTSPYKQTEPFLGLSGYATESWVTAGFYPLTGNPSGFLTSSSLTGYATQSWVMSQGYLTASALTPYLTSATAASTYALIAHQVPAGGTTGQVLAKASSSDWSLAWTTIIPGDRYLTTSTTSNAISNGAKTFTVGTGLSYSPTQDLTIAYDASNHMHGTVTSYNSGTGVLVVDIQNHMGAGTYASWTVNVGGTTPVASIAWGDITGTLGSQSDLSSALNAKLDSTTAASTYYLQTNPAGYIDSSALTGLAAESWVTAGFYPLIGNPSGFLTSSALTGYATESFVTSQGYITSSALAGLATESWVGSQGYLTDAPSDSQTYGRNNGAWVVAGGGTPVTNNDQLNTTVTADGSSSVFIGDSAFPRNSIVRLTYSGDVTVYLDDPSVFVAGDQVLIVNETNATLTFTANTGATVHSPLGYYCQGMGGVVAAVYIGSSTWVISGKLQNSI